MRRLTCSFNQNTSGSIAIQFALASVALFSAVGFAVDYARGIEASTALQAALDSAVLAGVRVLPANQASFASDALKANLGYRGASLASSSFKINPDGSLAGMASLTLPTSVAQIMGVLAMTVSGKATAMLASSGQSCIFITDKSGSQALQVSSGTTISAPACEVDVASTAQPAAIFNSNVSLDVAKTCIAGANVVQNGGYMRSLYTSCPVPADPYAGRLPVVPASACTVNSQNYAGDVVLFPGTYCGNFNFNGAGILRMQPGLYVFANVRWILNSGWNLRGDGVTLYFADQNSYIQINSGAEIDLSAPASGTYAGILIFEPSGLPTSQFTINGAAGHALTGLIYLPSRDITFNSMSNVTSEALMLVVHRLNLDQANWRIKPVAQAMATGTPGGVTGSRLMQ